MARISIRRLTQRLTVITALVVATALPTTLHAQTSDPSTKLASDLLTVVSNATAPAAPWTTIVNGQRLVRVIVTVSSADPLLTDLRQFVLSLGGSIQYNYTSLRAMSITWNRLRRCCRSDDRVRA